MSGLPLTLQWPGILLRLALTVLAGVAIGYNRSEHGKAAGMRTTVLACLAASVAMIQVNLLLPTAGRASDSFVMNDLMRLPLGILTGVGFIGGGAILRRDNIVVGVTTAATLWMVTVIGLCFGGGQLGLGSVATLLALAALWGLKGVERHMRQDFSTRLVVEIDRRGPDEADIRHLIGDSARIAGATFVRHPREGTATLRLDLVEPRRTGDTMPPGFVDALAGRAGVTSVSWRIPRQG